MSANHRYLERADGTPFFWLGDTAWELLHRLNHEETEVYLRNRAAKGFNVILTVALAEYDFDQPNAYGALPLENNDPTKPNPAYFEHVDWVVHRAGELGLYVGLLPSWGDKWNQKWGVGPEIFTPQNAEIYGEWLGRRYRDQPVIWVLGGDRPVETPRHFEIIRAMARGLKQGDGGTHLMTFHPPREGENWFHDDAWLDFEMFQSGHRAHNVANYERNRANRAQLPTKPTLEGEPCYEDHPVRGGAPDDWFDETDIRKSAYWSILSGACGHTYGNHNIWQFLDPARHPAINRARTPWRTALDQPGAIAMSHLQQFFKSLPWTTLEPDDSLLPDGAGVGANHIAAAVTRDRQLALIYTPTGAPLRIDGKKLRGEALIASWFNPRDGTTVAVKVPSGALMPAFTPPLAAQDWVLVLKSPRHP